MLFELLHRSLQPPTVNVEVSASGAQIRVPEKLADIADRNACLVEAGASFVPQIAQLKPLQAGCTRSSTPRGLVACR